MRLCYIEDNWAYFTNQPLSIQTGDDWDDAPYQHNAGIPYDSHGEVITKVAWDGDLESPQGSYSVDQINAGVVAWLASPPYAEEIVAIPGGTSFEDFARLVQKAGGNIYTLDRSIT